MAFATGGGDAPRDVLPSRRAGDRFARAGGSSDFGGRLPDATACSDCVSDLIADGYCNAYRDGAPAYCDAVPFALTDSNRHTVANAIADFDSNSNSIPIPNSYRDSNTFPHALAHTNAVAGPDFITYSLANAFSGPGLYSDSNPVAHADESALQQPGSKVALRVGRLPRHLERLEVTA